MAYQIAVHLTDKASLRIVFIMKRIATVFSVIPNAMPLSPHLYPMTTTSRVATTLLGFHS